MNTTTRLTPLRRRIFIVALGLLGVLLASAVVVVLRLTGVLEPVTSRQLQARQLKQLVDRPGRPGALIVGDSFLNPQWHFERTLGRDLPAYLDRRGFNAVLHAEGGTGPHRYCGATLQLLPRVRPQLLIVFFFVGNDVTDTMRDFELRPPRPKTCSCDTVKDARGEYDWEKMKRCGVDAELVEMAMRGKIDPSAPDDKRINPHLICAGLDYPPYYRANLAVKGPGVRAAWQINDALLRLIRDEARHFGAELYLVVIPAALQVDPSYGDFLRKLNFKVDGLARSDEPQRRLKALCEREKIGYLDLLPACLASPRRKQLFFKYDDHFTGEGHALAYDLVLEKIIKPWLAARRK